MLEAEIAWILAALQRHVAETGQQLEIADPVPVVSRGFEFFSLMFTVTVRGESGTFPLIVKILPLEELPLYLTPRLQFRNESLFYGDFLSFVYSTAIDGRKGLDTIEAIGSSFPKLFCSYEDDSQCMLALEDLTPLGFKHAPKILDLTHMKLSLQELGRFHALSYIAKKKSPEMFYDLVKRFHPWNEEMYQQFSYMRRGMVQYAAELFQTMFPDVCKKYADNLAKLDAVADMFVKFIEPEEPLAVLCHGDYNRNNIMFKYDADGRPSSLKVIDFQLSMYSSPAIDLSLILFMSTSPEVRDTHWDELFDVYHSSLLDTMEQSLCYSRDILEEYSKELLAQDFNKFCLYGFIATAFYLPVTMLEPEDSMKLMSECSSKPSSERVAIRKRFCSDEVKHRIAVLLKVLLERNIL